MPKRVKTPYGVIQVPDDVTAQDLDSIMTELESEHAPPPQTVAEDEPDTWMGGAARGFLEGAREGMSNLRSVAKKVHPPAAMVAEAVIPDPLLELRMPRNDDWQRWVPPLVGGAAGIGAGVLTANPLIGIGTAMAATGATGAAMGKAPNDIAWDVGMEGLGGAPAVIGPALARGGRRMIRSAWGIKGDIADTDRQVQTILKEGLDQTYKGKQKIASKIDQLNAEVRKTIEGIEGNTLTVDRGLANMEQLYKESAKGVASPEELAALRGRIDMFRERFNKPVSAIEMHDRKVQLQREGAAAYTQETPTLRKQGDQKLTQGLREEIEAAAENAGVGDRVGPVNARVGNLREIEDVINSRPEALAFTGGDVASAAMFGPINAGIRIALRNQSRLGRGVALVGDTLNSIYRIPTRTVAPAGKMLPELSRQTMSKEALEAIRAEEARVLGKGGVPGIERPGDYSYQFDRFGDIPVTGTVDDVGMWEARARANTMPNPRVRPETLDELGVPQAGTETWTPDALDQLGIPVERGSTNPSDLYLEQYLAAKRQELAASQQAQGTARTMRGNALIDQESRRMPQQMTLGEPAPDARQLPMFEDGQPHPLRLDAQTQPQAVRPQDLHMSGQTKMTVDPTIEVLDPEELSGVQPNFSGTTDASTEALKALAEGWEYAAARVGSQPRPLIGIRPEDFSLNPGEQLVRRKKGKTRWMRY